MTKDELVAYWKDSALDDLVVMESLFENDHYVWALFIGHLVLEKLLKAFYVKRIGIDTPFSHNLLKLARAADLPLHNIGGHPNRLIKYGTGDIYLSN